MPKSGYDVSSIYVFPLEPDGTVSLDGNVTADTVSEDASDNEDYADTGVVTPDQTVAGYLTGDGLAPDGFPVVAGIQFPSQPNVGDYCLRTDYLPNRLFRWSGGRWAKVEDVQRTDLTLGANNQTLRNTFTYNPNQYTTYDITGNAVVRNEKQSLSNALRPRADNS